jgi:hypothetical protein
MPKDSPVDRRWSGVIAGAGGSVEDMRPR